MPLLFFLLQLVRPFTRGKLREMIDDKNHNFCVEKETGIADRRPLWIHAASGEIEYARSVIREVRKQYPTIPILVTYSSPSAKKILQGLDIEAWAALPWDFSFSFERFFKKWNPRLLLVSRTDLWPVMANSTWKKKIPAFLFSATFAKNSSRLSGPTKYLTCFSLNRLNKIFCVAAEDKENLRDLQLETPVEVLGDTRFDQVIHRLEHPKPIRSELKSSQFTFIMGSTWPEDEEVLLKVLEKFSSSEMCFVLAPHEISEAHLRHLEAQMARRGLSSGRYSSARPDRRRRVLLIDQVGVLAELYTWGQVAFVGGSFRRQVHSVMEPLAAGLPVVVGPFHHNNREALAYQKKNINTLPLVFSADSAEEIAGFLEQVQKWPAQDLRHQVRAEVLKNQGSTALLLGEIKGALYKPLDSQD